MFAVVNIAGQQFKVAENTKYYVPRLQNDPESEVTFDDILLYADDNGVKIGSDAVSNIKVTAKVIEHCKDNRILVFKKKRRTGYEKCNGHRQQLTRIEITKIG